jgi:hypothetical protein
MAGKRVLEIGPASGYLTFYMESQGAEVVSVELPPVHVWNVVSDAGLDLDAFVEEVRDGVEHVPNGYWFTHERVLSRAGLHRRWGASDWGPLHGRLEPNAIRFDLTSYLLG